MPSANNASSDVVLDLKTLLTEKPTKCGEPRANSPEFAWNFGKLEGVIAEKCVEEIIKETDEMKFKVIGEANFVQLKKIQ
uniref:Uncharacterized protein n=1 Tax=Panagrolaimus sp. JU765 TaxID=591449 RepID=A0AC34PU95_9BILA